MKKPIIDEQKEKENINNPIYKTLSPKTNFQFTNQHSHNESHTQQTQAAKLNESRSSKKSVKNYLDRRHKESQEKINKLRSYISTSETQNMTFKPKISNNSKLIVEKLINQEDNQYDFNEIISNTRNYKPEIKSNIAKNITIGDKKKDPVILKPKSTYNLTKNSSKREDTQQQVTTQVNKSHYQTYNTSSNWKENKEEDLLRVVKMRQVIF